MRARVAFAMLRLLIELLRAVVFHFARRVKAGGWSISDALPLLSRAVRRLEGIAMELRKRQGRGEPAEPVSPAKLTVDRARQILLGSSDRATASEEKV